MFILLFSSPSRNSPASSSYFICQQDVPWWYCQAQTQLYHIHSEIAPSLQVLSPWSVLWKWLQVDAVAPTYTTPTQLHCPRCHISVKLAFCRRLLPVREISGPSVHPVLDLLFRGNTLSSTHRCSWRNFLCITSTTSTRLHSSSGRPNPDTRCFSKWLMMGGWMGCSIFFLACGESASLDWLLQLSYESMTQTQWLKWEQYHQSFWNNLHVASVV